MIEIPGYRIQRQLGQGGMASVYLALQESVQREVALKVMAPTLVGAEFGERFLREARIAAKLHHPHVVQVHDVGRAGDWHYIAMEYLGGGPLLRPGDGGDIAFALRVVRQIAGALGYAHARGVIHRDIKPDNILLREDGAAVLTDFGIARASDATRMTQAGMIMGTPHYMAPEQATGAAIDGRADLYSLGVVFYELLVGRVPFDATDWIAVGMMHLSQAPPPLPPLLASLQPLLDGLLAKNPDDRFQSGAELAAAIEEVELERAGPAPTRPRTPGRPRTPTVARDAVATEPVLGSVNSSLLAAAPRRRYQTPEAMTPAARGWLLGALLVAGIAAGAGYVWREPLRAMLPPTQHEALLLDAERALRDGRLSAADGSGARELYRSANALNPDDRRAADGLRRTAEAFLQQARSALDDQQPELARSALAAARELGIAGNQADELESTIQQRAYREEQIVSLVNAAQAALRAGRLDEDERSALALYQQAARVDRESEIVRHGLRETLGQLLARASAQLERGELDAAEQQIERVAAIDPGHQALGEHRTRLADAREAQRSGRERRLADAAELLRRGRLDEAAAGYRALLADAPEHPQARDGLKQVASEWLRQADAAMADFAFERADGLIARARAVDPGHAGLRRAEQRLAERQRVKVPAAAATLGAAEQARLQQLLDGAAKALAAGQLVLPPGESAYDHYKNALSIDPGNQAARAGIAAIPAAAKRRFEEALGQNRRETAKGYLESLETVDATDADLPAMRRRLAASLLGYADERLGAGEIDLARRAVHQASALDPTNASLPALNARLEQARK
jgi:serine/threonine-protein kinase PpkA